MKKLLAVLFLCSIALFIVGCAKDAQVEPAVQESAEDINIDIEKDISELDTLDEDMDLTELDTLEQELADLENLEFE